MFVPLGLQCLFVPRYLLAQNCVIQTFVLFLIANHSENVPVGKME